MGVETAVETDAQPQEKAADVPTGVPLWRRVLLDVRTERAVKMACVVAAAQALYYYAPMTVSYEGQLLGIPSQTYWTALIGLVGMPASVPYHIGYVPILVAALFCAAAVSGCILSATLPALQLSAASGYAVLCVLLTVLIGPLWASGSTVMNYLAMAVAIFLEMSFIPMLDAVGLPGNDLSVARYWEFSFPMMAVNFAAFAALWAAGMLLPPWSTARQQLHERTSAVLRRQSGNLAASAEYLQALRDTGAAPPEPPKYVATPPSNLYGGYGVWMDSISECCVAAAMEPSLVHPGTCAAPPQLWADLVERLAAMDMQARALQLTLRAMGEAGVVVSAGGGEVGLLEVSPGAAEGMRAAMAAASATGAALSDATAVERRGERDVPVLDFSPLLLARQRNARHASLSTRAELAAALEHCRAECVGAVCVLGRAAIAEVWDGGEGAAGEAPPQPHGYWSLLLLSQAVSMLQSPPPAPLPRPKLLLTAKLEQLPRALGLRKGHSGEAAAPPPPPRLAGGFLGLQGICDAWKAIQAALSVQTAANAAKQLFYVSPLPFVLLVLKDWPAAVVSIAKQPFALLRDVSAPYRASHSLYFFMQFAVGIWTLVALGTFAEAYRKWMNAGGHLGSWTVMSFIICLKPSAEASIEKGILRAIFSAIGAMFAWGVSAVSFRAFGRVTGAFMIPINSTVMALLFWFRPASASSFQFERFDAVNYAASAAGFSYNIVSAYCNTYGGRAAATTRATSQALGSVFAVAVSLVILPISGLSSATGFTAAALHTLQDAAEKLRAEALHIAAGDAPVPGGGAERTAFAEVATMLERLHDGMALPDKARSVLNALQLEAALGSGSHLLELLGSLSMCVKLVRKALCDATDCLQALGEYGSGGCGAGAPVAATHKADAACSDAVADAAQGDGVAADANGAANTQHDDRSVAHEASDAADSGGEAAPPAVKPAAAVALASANELLVLKELLVQLEAALRDAHERRRLRILSMPVAFGWRVDAAQPRPRPRSRGVGGIKAGTEAGANVQTARMESLPKHGLVQAVMCFVRSVLSSPNKDHAVQLQAHMQGDAPARTSSVGYTLLVARLAHSIWLPSLKCAEVLYAYADRAGHTDDGVGTPGAQPAQQV